MSKTLIALIGISFLWFLIYVSTLSNNVGTHYKSARKKILIFKDKNFKEFRFNGKSGLTT